MQKLNKKHPVVKTELHPRNKHRGRYDFNKLIKACPDLARFVEENQYGDESINFFDDKAVKMLNKALLIEFYGVSYWDVPEGYLCPPIPGRADYIHNIADLLYGETLLPYRKGEKITCLDVGIGANCIYPIIGAAEYNWNFIGTETSEDSIVSAERIIKGNEYLADKVLVRLQESSLNIFKGVIEGGETIDVTICNPPFHGSKKEAEAGNRRKSRNLSKGKKVSDKLNFGGKFNELWCDGGELNFIKLMIKESKSIERQCLWFTSLVSKKENVEPIVKMLKSYNVKEFKVLEMGQGNKISRIVAWTFLPPLQHAKWKQFRWRKD